MMDSRFKVNKTYYTRFRLYEFEYVEFVVSNQALKGLWRARVYIYNSKNIYFSPSYKVHAKKLTVRNWVHNISKYQRVQYTLTHAHIQ